MLAFESQRQRRLVWDAALICALFFGTHAVYRASTGHVQNCDSVYSLIVGEKLLTRGTVNLADTIPVDPAARAALQGYAPATGLPYQLIRRTDPRHPGEPEAVYYGYPLGSTILSLPFIAYEKMRHRPLLDARGFPNNAAENALQLKIAAAVCSAIVVLFYALCRFYLPPWESGLIAAGFAFGSPVWSTLARSLWSHTGMVALLSGSLVLILGRGRIENARRRTDLVFGAALGTLLFAMLFTRMHGLFSAAAIGLYLLIHHRRMLWATLLAGGLWSALAVAISLHAFGTLSPPSVYDLDNIDGQDVPRRFAGLMLAPSRGILIFCPYLAVVLALLIVLRRRLATAGMLLPAAVAIASHTLLFSCYNGWHMGSSYGPRYFCDLLPWFVILTAIAVRGIIGISSRRWKIAALALLATSFAWGLFVHARGANAVKAWLWNARAAAVPPEEAVGDWRHPQFLAGLTFEVKMDGRIEEK